MRYFRNIIHPFLLLPYEGILLKLSLVLQVPVTLYFMTHAYFCFYHAFSNVVLRRTAYAVQQSPGICQWLTFATVVFVLAYITALMETVTIAHFPYYKIKVSYAAYNCIITLSACLGLHTCLDTQACIFPYYQLLQG